MRETRTALITAIAIGLLAGSAVGVAAQSEEGTHVVAQDGSGDFTTITEAVAAAEDGDTIMVRPGTYTEAITITKDIILIGDPEDPAGVVVDIPGDGPTADFVSSNPRYAFWIQGADADIGHLTIRGPSSNVSAVVVTGGDPLIHDLVEELDEYTNWPYGFVYIRGDAGGTIRDNVTKAFLWIDDTASPLIENNDINNVIRNDGDSDARIVGNELGGVLAEGGATPTIEDNLIDFANNGGADGGFYSCGVTISGLASPAVASNVIHNAPTGICASSGASGSIIGNEITGSGTAITLTGSDSLVAGNDIHDNTTGIMVARGAPMLEGNTITGGNVGLQLSGDGSSPTLLGNTICGNETNLRLLGDAEMPATEGNEICPDGLAMASE